MNYNSNKKKLPVTYPTITSHPEHANLLAVLQNNSISQHWIMNNYIQLCMGLIEEPNPFFFPRSIFEICPYIDYLRLSKDIVKSNWPSFIDFIVEFIDQNYYIHVALDQYCIEQSGGYHKTKYYHHPTMIFGYDLIEKTIDIADFYKNSKYIFTTNSCNGIDESYATAMERKCYYYSRFLCIGNGDVFLYKPVDINTSIWVAGQGLSYKFDIMQVIKLIEDYLYSRNSFANLGTYESQYFSSDRFVFGISIFDLIKDNFNRNFYCELGYIPNKTFSILVDHKKIMLDRIDYLSDNGYLRNKKYYYNMFEDILSRSNILLGLSLKFNITKDYSIINRIISLIDILIEKEKFAYEVLLKEIRSNVIIL